MGSHRADLAGVAIAIGLFVLAGIIVWDVNGLGGGMAYGIGPQAMPLVIATGVVILAIGNLVLDQAAHRITRDGKALHLTRTEWELLRVLMSNAGRVLTHQQLFREVWSGRAFGDAQQYLRVYVAHLRRKIEPDPVRPQYIHTEAGVGYRFATATEVLSRA